MEFCVCKHNKAQVLSHIINKNILYSNFTRIKNIIGDTKFEYINLPMPNMINIL
jgi:hypothetical protein